MSFQPDAVITRHDVRAQRSDPEVRPAGPWPVHMLIVGSVQFKERWRGQDETLRGGWRGGIDPSTLALGHYILYSM